METEQTYSINAHKSNEECVDSNVEVQTLREELDRLNTEFLKANEERAKAAEYGLILLEEKQNLQYKNEELVMLYDSTKQELDKSAIALRQLQRDYEKRVKHVEMQREDLISEMDGREKELLSRVESLEEERRGLERTTKKMSSQYNYLSETNDILSSENERLKQELSVQKEELRVLKRKDQDAETDIQRLTVELDASRNKLDTFYQYEKTLEELNEQNQSLHSTLSHLQDQFDHVTEERDELERQKRDIVLALNEEREVKSFLENKLKDDILRSPHHVSWLTESTVHLASPDGGPVPVLGGQVPVSASAPTSPTLITEFPAHSTPLLSRQMAPSLFSEIQTSMDDNKSIKADSQVNAKLTELNDKLEAKNIELSESLKNMSSEVDKWKARYKKTKEEKNMELESMADELAAKKEINAQLNSQLSVANKEKASFEIEIEGLREETGRIREAAKLENEKLEKEFQEVHRKWEELQARVVELEEKLGVSVGTGERMETILVNSTGELVAMVAEITNIHKAMKTLQRNDGETGGNGILNGDLSENDNSDETYTLSVHEGKKKLKILKDNQTLEDVSRLKELLRQLRLPLEEFTKRMLESSLAQSSKLISGIQPTTGGEVPIGKDGASTTGLLNNEEDAAKKVTELESNLNKIRARLANRTEEVNQLRAIMKARQTTVDVTVSSLRSKLDGQRRAHETEINQYKHKVKTLRKERDEQISLGALTSRRCQEYLDEISKVKRKVEELRGEGDHLRSESKLLSVYLERSIQQKLCISQELERYREEEERTRVIPLTLSSSRV